jgi:hypothetical protein
MMQDLQNKFSSEVALTPGRFKVARGSGKLNFMQIGSAPAELPERRYHVVRKPKPEIAQAWHPVKILRPTALAVATVLTCGGVPPPLLVTYKSSFGDFRCVRVPL